MVCFVVLFIFYFSVQHATQTTLIPNFKWSQTNESILVTAYYDPSKIIRLKNQAKIDMSGVTDFSPKTKDHKIEKEWLFVSWNNFKLELHLRGDVDPDGSWCRWKEKLVVCSLKKKVNHIFDFLTTRDQIEKLKPFCTKDWEATTVGDTQDEFEFVDTLKFATIKDIEKYKKKKKPTCVRAFYPWCSKCRDEQLSFESAVRDKRMKKKKMRFRVVDAREDRETGKYLSVNCDTPCNFKVYSRGKEYTIAGKSKKKDFVDEILLEIEDPYKEMKTREKVMKYAKKNPTVAGYFEDDTSEQYKTFIAVAKKMKRKKEIQFALLQKHNPNWAKSLTNGANRVVLINDNRNFYQDKLNDTKKFENWVETYARGIFEKYVYEWKQRFADAELNLPILKVFVKEDDIDKKLRRKMSKLAKKYETEFVFLWFPKSQKHMLANMGLGNDAIDAFGISTALDDDSAKHYKGDGEPTVDKVTLLLEAYKNDKAVQSFKTEKAPEAAFKHGDVRSVVQTTWMDEIELSELNSIVLMSKNWSTNRVEAFAALEDIAEVLEPDKTVKVCNYDYNENYYDHEKFSGKKHDSDLILYFYYHEGGELKRVQAETKDWKWNHTDADVFSEMLDWLETTPYFQDPVRKDGLRNNFKTWDEMNQEEQKKEEEAAQAAENEAEEEKKEL